MTQHTPLNTNNNPNATSSNVLYSHKTRGTHTRVSRVRVTTVGKASFPEKQHRYCPRCKESTSNMKMLTARVGKIEQLVDVLAKTTRGLASMSKREDRFAHNNLKFKGLDLTRCTLQELQKLVVATTNVMNPPNSTINTNKPTNPPTSSVKDNTLTDITTTTNNEEKVLYSEPTEMEDVKIHTINNSPKHNHHHQPIKTVYSSLKSVPRHDSGCAFIDEKDVKPSNNN